MCRKYVCERCIDDVIYNKASRWWGKIFTDNDKDGRMVELDVVAESLDKKHIIVGECKWTGTEDAAALTARLQAIIPLLPFVKKSQNVHVVLFTKVPPKNAGAAIVFLPEDVLK